MSVQSIIRVIHNRENPFVQLNKKSLWNSNLSLLATGLWARCMARPDNWSFYISELSKVCKESKETLYRAIRELIEQRYVLRIPFKVKDKLTGRVVKNGSGYHYVFFEAPIQDSELEGYVEYFKKSFLNTGNQVPGETTSTGHNAAHIDFDLDWGFPGSGKVSTTNTDPILQIEIHTPPNPLEDEGEATGVAGVVDEFELKGTSEGEPPKPAPKIPDKPKSNPKRPHRSGDHDFEHCMLTDEEYHKLTEKLGDKERDYWINEINEAAEQTGPVLFNNGGKGHKPHKSHYLTILSWKRWRDENRSTSSRQVPKTGGIPPKLSVVATLRSRLEPKGYTHQAAFAKIEIFSSNGHTVAKFSESDHDGIERWLQEKGL